MSPPLADKHNIALEHSRVSKDLTRGNFMEMIGNLPQITKKPIAKPGPPMSNPERRTKRKASVPQEAKQPSRVTNSLGPSTNFNTEASTNAIGGDM